MVSIENLDLNLLRVLHFVVETKSVARAAERLAVTPSAVSNSLARLRELLGDPLFVRSGRSLTPTPLTQILEPRLAEMFCRIRELIEDDLQRFEPAQCRRTFTIASADNISSPVLPQMINALRASLPLASFNIVTLDFAVSANSLAEGSVHLLLGIPPEDEPLRRSPIYAESLLTIYDPAQVHEAPLSVEAFLGRSHVAVAINQRYRIDYVDGVLRNQGMARKVAIEVPQFLLAAMLIPNTPLLAVLPERMALEQSARLGLVTCPLPFIIPPVQVYQAWHARTDTDEACRYLRKVVIESFARAAARQTW